MNRKFKGVWKTPGGGLQTVFCEAKNYNIACQMFEAQYGKGKVMNVCETR